jgi:alpha-mannosidase
MGIRKATCSEIRSEGPKWGWNLTKREFYYVGSHHIDLAWKRPKEEYIEMLEVFCLRILDALDTRPDFRFVLEQASHYRNLIVKRPDLVARLKPYVSHPGRW